MPCKEDDDRRTRWMKGCIGQATPPPPSPALPSPTRSRNTHIESGFIEKVIGRALLVSVPPQMGTSTWPDAMYGTFLC
jgi:hypothetical protein